MAEAFPDAWIEDPALTAETDAVLAPHRARFSWDATIHSIADIEALPYPPRMVNIKPSRLGGLRNLLDAYDYCAAHAIGNYGGGQFELGVGREHIQYLASLFHADAPNDVAPTGFNLPVTPTGLPSSPLAASPRRRGSAGDEAAQTQLLSRFSVCCWTASKVDRPRFVAQVLIVGRGGVHLARTGAHKPSRFLTAAALGLLIGASGADPGAAAAAGAGGTAATGGAERRRTSTRCASRAPAACRPRGAAATRARCRPAAPCCFRAGG